MCMQETIENNTVFNRLFMHAESEFNEFEPRLKSAKNRFQLSTGLNFETLITILSETNHIFEPRLIFMPQINNLFLIWQILFVNRTF